ncbi:MAG: prepilin-type N-terminal cleavage/methylation domain-containing protein [Patescibacteria group bacterium]
MQKRSSFGFTLIELLLVVTIMLAIGAPSSIFFSNFLTQNAVSSTQTRLINQLRKAQMYAMMGKENGNWGVKFGSNTITLFLQGNSAFDEKFSENPNITISGFSEIVFTKRTGLPSSIGTYNIMGNGISKQFTVNSQGVVSR